MATEQTPAQKFKELANMRGLRALRAIEGLSKLANKNKYTYTPAQVAVIKKAFQDELNACFAAFDKGEVSERGGLL